MIRTFFVEVGIGVFIGGKKRTGSGLSGDGGAVFWLWELFWCLELVEKDFLIAFMVVVFSARA